MDIYVSKVSNNGETRYDIKDTYIKFHMPMFFPVGIAHSDFNCAEIDLTTLVNAPLKVYGSFFCHRNQLTTLDHLPKHIGGELHCHDNPLQNLNGLKDVVIKKNLYFRHKKENELDYWVKALYNTDLDALEWHYDNHDYYFWYKTINLVEYVKEVIADIIKLKRLKKDLNV